MCFWVAVFCSRRYPCPSRDPHRPFVRRDPKVPCTVALSPSEPRDIPFVSLGELPSPPLSWVPGLPPGARSCGTYVGSGYVGPYPDLTCVRKGWILSPMATTSHDRRHPSRVVGFACLTSPSPHSSTPKGYALGTRRSGPFWADVVVLSSPEGEKRKGGLRRLFRQKAVEKPLRVAPRRWVHRVLFPDREGGLPWEVGYFHGDFTLGLAPSAILASLISLGCASAPQLRRILHFDWGED